MNNESIKVGFLPVVKMASENLLSHIKHLNIEDCISWEDMAKYADIPLADLQGRYRYVVEKVKQTLIDKHDRVLISVHGVGYIIGAVQHIVEFSEKQRKHCGRTLHRSIEKLQTVNVELLDVLQNIELQNEIAKNSIVSSCIKASDNKLLKSSEVKIPEISEAHFVKELLTESK